MAAFVFEPGRRRRSPMQRLKILAEWFGMF